MAATTAEILQVLDPILASLGLSFWDLEFKKDGPRWLLRVYIDREEGGVTLMDCEAVSRDLGAVLDVEDLIDHAYTLEVSSPGLDRALTRPEHYRKCIGRAIRVKTYQPIEGQKVLTGVLKGFDGSSVTIALATGAVLAIPMEGIAKASLEVVI
jgi:ribosome maturation factor RimP